MSNLATTRPSSSITRICVCGRGNPLRTNSSRVSDSWGFGPAVDYGEYFCAVVGVRGPRVARRDRVDIVTGLTSVAFISASTRCTADVKSAGGRGRMRFRAGVVTGMPPTGCTSPGTSLSMWTTIHWVVADGWRTPIRRASRGRSTWRPAPLKPIGRRSHRAGRTTAKPPTHAPPAPISTPRGAPPGRRPVEPPGSRNVSACASNARPPGTATGWCACPNTGIEVRPPASVIPSASANAPHTPSAACCG